MGTRGPDIERMEAQIKEWGAKIDSLVIRAETAGEHVQADYRQHAKELRGQWVDAQARLLDFKTAGTETWDAFRTGIECAWADLEVALKGIRNDDPSPKPPRKVAGPRTAPYRSSFQGTVPKQPVRHRGNNR